MQTRFLLALAMLFLLQGCYINSNLMFKTDKNFVFDTPPETPEEKYRIGKNDLVEFKLFSNGAFKILDYASGDATATSNFNRFNLSYYVENDGTVRFPIIGKVYLKDSTIRQAEFLLEQLYAVYYVEPFVQLQVTNKRVIIFPGNGSDAKIVPLANNNTTLLEVIAAAGGITDRGKAKRVKVFRRDGDKRKAYLVDLSTIEGLKHADMIVQANDIVYVEPVPQYGREVVTQIAPYISLLTSAILVYTVFQRL